MIPPAAPVVARLWKRGIVSLPPELQRLRNDLMRSICPPPCAHEVCMYGRGLLKSACYADKRDDLKTIGIGGFGKPDSLTYQEMRAKLESAYRRTPPDAVYQVEKWNQRHDAHWACSCPLPGHQGDRNSGSFRVSTDNLGWVCFSHCGSGSVLAYLHGGTEPRGLDWWNTARAFLSMVDGGTTPEAVELQARYLEAWGTGR